jgi:DNA-binding CsgD family transcriptional regulator
LGGCIDAYLQRIPRRDIEWIIRDVRFVPIADIVTMVLSNGVSSEADDEVLLTPRELEVLMLLAEGLSNRAIARRLGISVHTAKFHVGALIDKLDAVGRTDAVAHAARRGVIHL